MQSRLALTATKFSKLVPSATRNRYLLQRSLASSGGAEGRTADPAVQATDLGDAYPENRPLNTPTKEQPPLKENDPFVPPKPPHSPSVKLESNPVNQSNDPFKQQRRRFYVSNTIKHPSWRFFVSGAINQQRRRISDVSCIGADEDDMDRQTQIRERVKDNKEYYEHHKASPLSEIEIADTRKPLTRATDGGGGDDDFVGGGGVVAESAEDTLLRAKRIWLENAMRGDPDSPHGRVLRELRGEYW